MMQKQNAHLTFKENVLAGRHGWIRLTPAYSYRLVEETLGPLDRKLLVFDPFSGSGTTGLVAAELGFNAVLAELNPFLVWLARAKTRNYEPAELEAAWDLSGEIVQQATDLAGQAGLWRPAMHQIERWWPAPVLDSLSALRASLDKFKQEMDWFDLLEIAFCRTLIGTSRAAFNHQSMSFQTAPNGQLELGLPEHSGVVATITRFEKETRHVIATANSTLTGRIETVEMDSRSLSQLADGAVDVLYSSPPYANRMSYIRELRPYMYWLRYLDKASEAGELDWRAIGGTWGVATSRLNEWKPEKGLHLPALEGTLELIERSNGPNARLLAMYVHKYFADMDQHIRAAFRVIASGGRVVYVIGNSVFYGVVVHVEKLYRDLLSRAGFGHIKIESIRKRNSKKELFEYVVSGVRA